MKRVSETIAWNRRDLLKYGAALLWATPLLAQAPRGQRGQGADGQRGAGQRGADAARGQAAGGQRGQAAQQTGTQLVLLGTQGGPGVSATRTQSANAVLVDGRPYIVDCGYGALKALVQAGLTLGSVSNIFVTHLHDDHTADIAAFLALKWTGTQNPGAAVIHGPYGTAAMVDAAIAFSRANVEIRKVDEGRTVDPKTIFSGRNLNAPKVSEVFKDDRVTVQAVENAHFPDRAKAKMEYRSLSYRFNTPTRSLVFSGDTTYSENLIELARGADVFVCEVLTNVNRQDPAPAAAAAPARGAGQNAGGGGESIARHVRETHSTPDEVGRMAAAARVKTLVLSHQVGGARGGTNDAMVAEIKKVFSGEIIVGADQMRL